MVELGECRNRKYEDSGKALVADTITVRSHRYVVMADARGGGQRGRASSSTPVACCFGLLQRLLPLTTCGNPSRPKTHTPSSDTYISENGPPFPGRNRLERAIRKQMARKITLFGPIKVDWFFGQKTFVFSFQKPPVRDGLR